MPQSPVSKKSLLFTATFSVIILVILFCKHYLNSQSFIVFCNVGQGDGAYIRIDDQIDILVDTGPPNNMMLTCLGKYMPFYDRTLEYIVISHPQSDHAGGLFESVKRYKIKTLISLSVNENQAFSKRLKKILIDHHIQPTLGFKGINLALNQSKLIFLSPSKNQSDRYAVNVNDLSLVTQLTTPKATVLFTGDASAHVLNSLKIEQKTRNIILKVPHHGSKYGLSQKSIMLADPRVAVISAGKNNSYGHPSHEVLDLLKANSIKIKRTDEEGDIFYQL